MLALGALLLLPGLGRHPLVDPTEARHAQVAREMAREGRLLVPLLYGEPYRDKPSPYYLLPRAALRLPLRAETALRLPSAFATLASAAILFGFARRRTGILAAAVGAAIFLACPLVVVLGRFADQDALLAAFVTAAVAGLLDALDGPPRRLAGVALAMGLGSWVKGPVAIVLPTAVATVVVASRRRLPGIASLRAIATSLAGACAIFAAWVVPTWLADPDYVSAFLLRHNVGRFAEAATGHAKPAWYYLPVLLAATLPWSSLLPAAIAARGDERNGARDAERDLLAWAGAIVGFYSLSRAKSAGYVLPAVGPLALWLGSRLVAIAGGPAPEPGGSPGAASTPGRRGAPDGRVPPHGGPVPNRLVETLLRGALVVVATLGTALPIAAWIALRRDAATLATSVALRLLPLAPVGSLAARAAWRAPRPLHATAAAVGAFSASLVAIAYLAVAPLVGTIASDRHLARFAAERAPGLPLVGFRLHPASLAFYSPGPVRKETAVDEVKRLAAAGPIVVLAREKDERALADAGLALHRWTEPGRHCLFGTTPRPPVPPEASAAASEHDGG